jgi:hypothetical protein
MSATGRGEVDLRLLDCMEDLRDGWVEGELLPGFVGEGVQCCWRRASEWTGVVRIDPSRPECVIEIACDETGEFSVLDEVQGRIGKERVDMHHVHVTPPKSWGRTV